MDAEEPGAGHCFRSWEITGQGRTLRDNFSELTFRVQVNLPEPVTQGHFGLSVLSESNFVVIGWGFDGLNLQSGVQEINLRLPQLPIKPGVYTVACSLFNRGNNLTGGQLVDNWYATPPLVVDTAPLAHPQDRWAGVLNIPASLHVSELTEASR